MHIVSLKDVVDALTARDYKPAFERIPAACIAPALAGDAVTIDIKLFQFKPKKLAVRRGAFDSVFVIKARTLS